MYYGDTGKQITKPVMVKALTKLGDLLKEKDQRLDLVCCGGIVSLLYHGSRQMTHDVDVLFPNNPTAANILKELVDKVGEEFGLEHGPRDKWFNDSVSFIGLQSKSNTVVFRHSHLILKAADWHEMLSHKLTAFRGMRDTNDAMHFLKEISPKDKQAVFKKVSEYRPFVPHVPDKVFENRFNQIWEKVYGKS
ncbi:hypothetical protein [Litoribrevibacter albus]|uniref:Nucleotidyltransferase family protein n=1 Tax=Litoribrevibacter albus TaxID=1473156 RepID=A0AA37S7Q1_9GAMM|nr:hypothetical protein [Litoribrevibacter albus]GLQ29614.1 hypothetical protein GCM10007876_00920 [Litoribrevibacter albus]